jgi:hypothetical protein
MEDCARVVPTPNMGSAFGISYLAMSDQAVVEVPHINARCLRTSDSDAKSIVVDERRVFPTGA